MVNYPQELAQDAVCQNHTGRVTGLWFLPSPAFRLNTNELINVVTVTQTNLYVFYSCNNNITLKMAAVAAETCW